MDIHIQLQVTDKELKEFPEEYPTDTTNSPADQCNTQSHNTHSLATITCSPAKQLPILEKQTLIQLSVYLTYGKQTLVHLSVPSTLSVIPSKWSLIQPRAPPPSLLTLQPQPNLLALVRSLTPQAQRYICIGIHLSHQVSQPGPSSKPISNGPDRRWREGRKRRNSQKKTWKRRHQQWHVWEQRHGKI